MQPVIRRTTDGKCCEWCSELAGVYRYPNVPRDVYRRHENCGCIVIYDPGNGKYQDAHSKKYFTTEREAVEKKLKRVENSGNSDKIQSGIGDEKSVTSLSQSTMLQNDEFHPKPPKGYERDFQDCEELTLSDDEIKALQGLKELSKNSGFEYAQIRTESGLQKPYTSRLHSQVNVDMESLPANTAIMHSHTEECFLSNADFKKLSNPNIESTSCITPSGAIFTGKIGNGYRPSEEEFNKLTENIGVEANKTVRNFYPEFQEWTLEERTFMAGREEMYLTIRMFGWTLEGGMG